MTFPQPWCRLALAHLSSLSEVSQTVEANSTTRLSEGKVKSFTSNRITRASIRITTNKPECLDGNVAFPSCGAAQLWTAARCFLEQCHQLFLSGDQSVAQQHSLKAVSDC